jgi:hypothetical protein
MQVQIFSEILRQARENGQQVKPASQVLYDYIKNTGITPLWEDITLPGGNSIKDTGGYIRRTNVR